MDFGIVIDVSVPCPKNERSPIQVTEEGISVLLQPTTNLLVAFSMMALQLSRESNTVLFLSTVIDDKFVQYENGYTKNVTELGIVIFVRPLQPSNLQLVVFQLILL